MLPARYQEVYAYLVKSENGKAVIEEMQKQARGIAKNIRKVSGTLTTNEYGDGAGELVTAAEIQNTLLEGVCMAFMEVWSDPDL